jgi:uncharacterized membrane protein
MMGIDSGLLVAGMVLCALALPALLLAAVYVGFRALGPRRQPENSARAVLDRRLATGEIDTEEYYERESVLRSADRASAPHAGRKLA